jgi:hypothetical protein
MFRPLNMIEKRLDIIVRAAGCWSPKVSWLHAKRCYSLRPCTLRERPAQMIVDDGLERPPRPTRLRFKACCYVIFECESGSHIMMLYDMHHDVYLE